MCYYSIFNIIIDTAAKTKMNYILRCRIPSRIPHYISDHISLGLRRLWLPFLIFNDWKFWGVLGNILQNVLQFGFVWWFSYNRMTVWIFWRKTKEVKCHFHHIPRLQTSNSHVNLDQVTEIGQISPLRSCFRSSHILFFGSKSLCTAHARVGEFCSSTLMGKYLHKLYKVLSP